MTAPTPAQPMDPEQLARVRRDIKAHVLLDPWHDAPALLADRDCLADRLAERLRGLDALDAARLAQFGGDGEATAIEIEHGEAWLEAMEATDDGAAS